MHSITPKQKNVLNFIESYYEEAGIVPSMEEIRTNLKLKAISTVHQHVAILKKKGFITSTGDSIRKYIPLKKAEQLYRIPILGIIAACKPIEAIEQSDEYIMTSLSNVSYVKN